MVVSGSLSHSSLVSNVIDPFVINQYFDNEHFPTKHNNSQREKVYTEWREWKKEKVKVQKTDSVQIMIKTKNRK